MLLLIDFQNKQFSRIFSVLLDKFDHQSKGNVFINTYIYILFESILQFIYILFKNNLLLLLLL